MPDVLFKFYNYYINVFMTFFYISIVFIRYFFKINLEYVLLYLNVVFLSFFFFLFFNVQFLYFYFFRHSIWMNYIFKSFYLLKNLTRQNHTLFNVRSTKTNHHSFIIIYFYYYSHFKISNNYSLMCTRVETKRNILLISFFYFIISSISQPTL